MDALLNPNSFWNIVLLAGILMAFLSAMTLNLPATGDRSVRLHVPRTKKRTFLVLGLVLIFLSILMFALTNWAGLVSDVEQPSSAADDNQGTLKSSGFIAEAYAGQGDNRQEVASARLIQRRFSVLGGEFAGRISVYISDVRLVESSHLIIFRTQPGLPRTSLEYEQFRRLLPDSAILLDAKMSDRQARGFSFDDQEYSISLTLFWFLIGPDYGKIRIYRL